MHINQVNPYVTLKDYAVMTQKQVEAAWSMVAIHYWKNTQASLMQLKKPFLQWRNPGQHAGHLHLVQ